MVQNCKGQIKQLFVFAILVLASSGCASVPKKSALLSYDIGGVSYLPLGALCDLKAIKWDYDILTRTVSLSKDTHSLKLLVGDTLILVDGSLRHLPQRVDIYNGLVVVPAKFREDILDSLFKEYVTAAKTQNYFSAIQKIVIDAGHGGRTPGAIGATGLKEKEVTLDIARRLRDILKAEGLQVLMTRSTDRYVSLQERVDTANNNRVGLFVSIHANANRSRSLKGFEVYYISPGISDSQRALAAAKNERLNLEDSSLGSSSLSLKAILWDMIYNYDRAESVALSYAICKNAAGNLDTRVIGTKSANFQVLRGAAMPAVLVEVGFLSNANEERSLGDGSYRQKIAESINQGLKEYALRLSGLKQSEQDGYSYAKSER
jgi:N-acetylmuramoyl-L-alanine amidase